jgi:hypothetical protein
MEGQPMNINEAEKGIKVLAASRGVVETWDRLESLAKQATPAGKAGSGRGHCI